MSQSNSARIAADLRAWVEAAPAGSQLPPSRAIATKYGAGPRTVQKAMDQLAALGLTESRPGVGTFVRARRTAQPMDFRWQTAALPAGAPSSRTLPAALQTAQPDAIALHSGYPDRSLLPERLVHTSLSRAGRSATALTRPPAEGAPELRAWFARELASQMPASVSPVALRDVLVVPGSQAGLTAIFRALIGAGRPLLIESPTYWGAIDAATQAGVVLVPVPSGPEGPDRAALADAFARTGARGFYAQPTYANPTGAQWSPQLAREVLEIARDHRAFVIEDDWAHDFGIATQPQPLAALDDGGHVVYLRSLTKSIAPSVRVAALIARGPARDRIFGALVADNLYVSGVLQEAALDIVSHPSWRTQLRATSEQLRTRRDTLIDSVHTHCPELHVAHVPAGGLHLWAQLPDGTDVAQLVRDCAASGVLVADGADWFPAEPDGAYLRLNYSGPDPGRFDEAMQIIGAHLAAQS
ncbi:aminotransferase class I/II-fold pyridoxal phosphate-dependent enzyme [Epidermidibacterium keratini]|uniref:Aminotransferase class I/II-fold pyridoxal phosphate-dependent enzyme n=1 Tax=Epidermidibacterium keratini TaxID=1891644 RepID=A0A7L4YQG0_9ACTN|nr:PLP-dependent aminotransferase family protein [Epidermidibacterium keratini]QHC01163.1 aminotransferase class I/II-fold pyridoxal phosphate-dependent enzyme [Epidermidibacterium keratini]